MEHDDLEPSCEEVGERPFRAIDLLQNVSAASLLVESQSLAGMTGSFPDGSHFVPGPDFGNLPDSLEGFDLVGQSESELGAEVEIIPDDDSQPADDGLDLTVMQDNCILGGNEWTHIVSSQFSQYRSTFQGMQYPSEQGVLAQIFDEPSELELPVCSSLVEPGPLPPADAEVGAVASAPEPLPVDAKYLSVVSATKDLEYFESKNQKLELACGQWLELLSMSWKAFGIGENVSQALHSDSSGQSATEILRACFGIKSPSTLL